MTTLAQLRHQRAELLDKANEINHTHQHKAMPQAASDDLNGLLNQIERVDAQMDVHKASADAAAPSWKTGTDDASVKVLRNTADIRAHFAGVHQGPASRPGDDAMRLDDFVRGVAGMKTTASVTNALSVGTDTAGGFTVPTVVMPGILEALVPASALLSAGAGIVPLDLGGKTFTTAAINAIPTAAWRLESGAVAQSDPTFRAVTATPQSLAFYFKVSRELLADAKNLQEALTTTIAQSFARELDRVGLRGTGTAPEPRGILNTVGVQAIANGANGAALAGYASFFSAASAILSGNGSMPTAAIMSPRSLVKLGGLTDSTGQPLRVPGMLESLKLIATSAVPDNLTVGTSTDCSQIYIGDFTKVVFMLREQMSIQVATELFAGTGEVAFVCHMRADVAVMYPSVLSVVTGVRA